MSMSGVTRSKEMRAHEVAVLIALQLEAAPVDDQLGALIDARLHEPLMRVSASRGDDGAVIHVLARGVGADLELSMRGTSFSIRRSAVSSPTGTATETAMQRSPAAP
jgi:hypothetical protein